MGNAIVSLVTSVVMIAVNRGFNSRCLQAVIMSWFLGAAVSVQTALIVVPPVIRWQSCLRTASVEVQR